MGLYYSQYVRGASRSTNIIFEVLLDFLAILTLTVRFAIQNVRFIMIFSAFFELYEYIYLSSDVYINGFISGNFSFSKLLDNTYAHLN
jgi:hypothetical protein